MKRGHVVAMFNSNEHNSASGSEAVVGTLFLRRMKSLGRYDAFTGIITSQRVILAVMTSQMLADAAKKAKEQAKAEGKGFFGQWNDQLSATIGYTQRYLTMDPNTALAETPGNVALNNTDVQEVKLDLKNRQGNQHEFEVTFKSSVGNYSFRMDEREAFTNLLKQAFGERVKMPFGYLSSHGVKVRLFR